MEKEKPTILESADLVAFIISVSKKHPKAFLRELDHKVVFSFDEDVSPEIEAFYGNEMIAITDYCKNLKLIRSMIFTMKAGQR